MPEERIPDDVEYYTEDQIVEYLMGRGELDGDRLDADDALTADDLAALEGTEIGNVSNMIEEVFRAAGPQVIDETGISPQDLINEDRVKQFLEGQITLADLEGIDAETAYNIAQIGHAFAEQGHLDDARTIFEALEAYNPHDPYFHVALGTIYQRQNEHEAAKVQLEAALQLDPEDIDAHAFLGDVTLALGDLEGATKHYAEALRLDDSKEHPSAYRAAGALAIIDAIARGGDEADA